MKLVRGTPPPEAREGEWVGLDVETFHQSKPLHLPTGTFACLSICLDRDGGDTVWQVYDLKNLREALHRVRNGRWCLHNSLYDLRQLRRFDVVKPRPIWDTMLVERHLYAGYYTQTYGLKDVVRRYLGILMEKDTRERFMESTASVVDQKMAEYAAFDAWALPRIAKAQASVEGEGIVDFRSYHLANEPAIWAVLDMPPIRVDPDAWLALAKRLGDEGRKLQEFVGINVRSPKQVKAFVEARIGREVRDTSKETLEFLAGDAQDEEDGGIIELKRIMRARSLLMMEATYGESFLETMMPGGYILPGWKVDGADTGRTACSDPNLQNVPVRDMPEFRNVVIPSDGNFFIVSDASQQEIRVGAVATMDPTLLSMVRSGASVYMKVAEARYGEKISKKDPRYDQIKMVTLGTFYGATPSTIATRERIPRAQAGELQDWMFSTFKALPRWMQQQRQKAYDKGYVETLLGRRLWVNPHDRQWENNAVNSIIQGTAAELTKIALVAMHRELPLAGLPFGIVLQIHDELDGDFPKGTEKLVREVMNEAWMYAGKVVIPEVPFVTEFATGASWGCKK